MAIQELTVQGYRSFKDVTWRPGNLNLLVGPNASGKSNLLRLLQLISDTAGRRLATTILQSEGIMPLLWNHEAACFSWKIRLDPIDGNRDPIEDAIVFELEVQQLRGGSAFQITKDTLGNWHKFDQGLENSPLWIFQRDPRRAHVYDQKAHNLVRLDDFDENESLLPQIDAYTNPVPRLTKGALESWQIYHDLHVECGSPIRNPAVTQYATSVDSDGSNLVAVLHTLYSGNRDFKRDIDAGMQAAFGDDYEELKIQPAAKQQVQLAVQWKSSKDPHSGSELSDGTLRYLLLLTVLCNPDPPPLIAIDEPEIGLHPSMLPLIAEYAISASERSQIVISSHSPEFLGHFSEASSCVTVFHWEEGESSLFSIPPQELIGWLQRYRLGELFTSGDLDALAQPNIEPLEDIDQRLQDLPPEDAALPSAGGDTGG